MPAVVQDHRKSRHEAAVDLEFTDFYLVLELLLWSQQISCLAIIFQHDVLLRHLMLTIAVKV